MQTQEAVLEIETMARQFWAIGDPVRLRILRMLPSEPSCEQACNVSGIAERIGLSQPATSHHLRVVRQAGIITNKTMCRDMIYWVRPEVLSELKSELAVVLEGDA
ncbi:MAG: metalloregulator ArsR/SmtB family transcription factor [Verrucomicrobia bacterium]|nr:metalloregulator ArsR/SmtB family transcription factor [Verrucomicrobiota bacterium]